MQTTKMRKVCMSNAWQECPPDDTRATDGSTCVYLTDTEQVVCLINSYGPCTHADHSIDGWTTLIKDVSQSVVCYHTEFKTFCGAKCIAEARGVDGRSFVKLVNRPFFSLAGAPDWSRAAVVIMDMWDTHPYRGTRERAHELAPWIESFTASLRSKGALIIHSVSTNWILNWYGGNWVLRGRYDPTRVSNYGSNMSLPKPLPVESDARRKAVQVRYQNGIRDANVQRKYAQIGISLKLDSNAIEWWERPASYYNVESQKNLNNSEAFDEIVPFGPDLGEDQSQQPTGETSLIQVQAGDAIVGDGLDGTDQGDAFKEVMALTADRPYIVFCGINTNQCVIRRTNGMRTLYKAGKSMWIVRDLTDANCGVKDFRYSLGGHNQGTDITVDWIRDNLNSLDATSDALMGGQRHWFSGDARSPETLEKPYLILNMAHGLCISGLMNDGTFALFYEPMGATYNMWTLSPTIDGYWRVMNKYATAHALVGPVDASAGGGGYCYVQEPGTGEHADWKIDVFSDGPVLGVPFQLMNRKHSGYAAVAPDVAGGSNGVNTYFQKPASRLNSWWVLVDVDAAGVVGQ